MLVIPVFENYWFKRKTLLEGGKRFFSWITLLQWYCKREFLHLFTNAFCISIDFEASRKTIFFRFIFFLTTRCFARVLCDFWRPIFRADDGSWNVSESFKLFFPWMCQLLPSFQINGLAKMIKFFDNMTFFVVVLVLRFRSWFLYLEASFE